MPINTGEASDFETNGYFSIFSIKTDSQSVVIYIDTLCPTIPLPFP